MPDLNTNDAQLSADERYAKAVPVVRSFLESVLGLLGVEIEVDIDVEEDGLHCDLNTSEEDGGLLIGRHGATLDALQYLTLRVLQAEGFERMRITLDVGGYRMRREKSLRELAQGIGQRGKIGIIEGADERIGRESGGKSDFFSGDGAKAEADLREGF